MNLIKLRNFFILIILNLCIFNNINSYAKENNIKSVMVGHLYPVMKNKKILKKLFSKINKINPDYIFVLGDSNLDQLKTIKMWKNKFGDIVYFIPGNNEIKDGTLNEYKTNVGYIEKRVETKFINFLIINSNDKVENINTFIKNNMILNKEKQNILLVHHRIWDDALTSFKPYEHNKSFYFNEIYPNIKNNIYAIFAGDSKHQYFYDYVKTSGNQNMNNIFWLDRVGNINCYSIGTGLGKPRLGFIELVSNKEYPAIVIPHHINTEFDGPIPISRIIKHPDSINPSQINFKDSISISNKIIYNYEKYRKYFSKPFYIFLGILIALFLTKFNSFLKS
tara:strand:- start:4008 stop:5015 length:1008 start_codon:yes stop_codon:yes gene_type:complete